MGKPPEAFLKQLGARIRELRKEQGLSQGQLAFEAGVRREVITRLELGQQNTTIETLYGIAKTLEVHVHDLFVFGSHTETAPGEGAV